MKKQLLLILISLLLNFTIKAQSPSAIPYQAVARNISGNLIANQNISLRFTIHDVTANGTVVYRETQSVTTNTLGLFSVNIGQGTVVSGIFSTINWGSGSKFTQVEMDVTGGSSYIDMGTSQMLSVPYALYAATSGSGAVGATGATGASGINGVDGVTGATGTNGTNGIAGATGTDGQGGVTIAGINIAISGAGTSGSPYIINYSAPTYTIGLVPELGGYVFYVAPDGKHGLVSETQDQGSNDWYNAQNTISYPITHSGNGQKYTDWRLPTLNELNSMYLQRAFIGGFTNNIYWSSTQLSYNAAWYQNFGTGVQYNDYQQSIYLIRAVRAF